MTRRLLSVSSMTRDTLPWVVHDGAPGTCRFIRRDPAPDHFRLPH